MNDLGGAGSRRRQHLVAFKFPGARNTNLNAQQVANGRDAERHGTGTPASAVEPAAASLEAADAVSGGDGNDGQPHAGLWSRSEAARLLTEAILLDWTTPWQAGTARGASRRAGGRGSWAAAGGVRSRVAEATARLGTDWLSAAAAKEGKRSGDSCPPADPVVKAPTDSAGADWHATGEVAPADASSAAAAETIAARDEGKHSARNPGRLVISHDALVAWLESKSVRPPSQAK